MQGKKRSDHCHLRQFCVLAFGFDWLAPSPGKRINFLSFRGKIEHRVQGEDAEFWFHTTTGKYIIFV